MAFAILGGALGAWLVARETGVFAVRAVAVTGAPRAVQDDVRRALADTLGDSLLAVDLDRGRVAVEAIPAVRSVRFDRAYPHTLRVAVVPERPVAIVRRGKESFLVSARGRVIETVPRGTTPGLARIWVPAGIPIEPGQIVEGDLRLAVRAVAPLAGRRFPSRVTSVRVSETDLTLRLRSGLELRLGAPIETELKLAVARRLVPELRPGTTYLDVSVPDRPVAGTAISDPQVEVETSPSTSP